MAMSGGKDDGSPMMEMNTTPLIDVMLVLLIMFIITIPVQTHAVKIDLPVPTDSQSNVDPEKNKVMIDPAGTITWNGAPIDLAQLAQYLEQTKALPVHTSMGSVSHTIWETCKTYLTQQGKFLIGAIEERQRTIEKLAHIIVERQVDFFEHGPAKLRPLTMTDVAKEMGVHETTVGRAAASKWMLTPHGLREFRWFFTSGVATSDGGTVAQEGVQELIADILARENPAEPLADEAITAELRKRGVQIARRTVAKYREALGQPAAHMRRKRL